MQKKFNTAPAKRGDGSFDIGAPTVVSLLAGQSWDFVVLNDYTQGPARLESRAESVKAIREIYAPLIRSCGGVPVLLITWAYRAPAKGSDDLGSPEEFTHLLREGYAEYKRLLEAELGFPRVLLAPAGDAFLLVKKERTALWRELFHTDNFHPSPRGTYLEACVLHCTLLGEPPSRARSLAPHAELFARARRMQPPEEPALPELTPEDAAYLRDVAARTVLGKPSSDFD